MKKLETYLPRSWDGVEAHHLLALCKVANQNYDDAHTQNDALLFELLRIPMRYYQKITLAQKLDMFEIIQFLKEDVKLNNWLIPSGATPFRVGVRDRLSPHWGFRGELPSPHWGFRGPDQSFMYITGAELAQAQFYFSKYVEDKSIDNLNMLCAVLYRPVSLWPALQNLFYPCDIRSRLNDRSLLSRSQRFNKVPLYWREAVYMNFRGILNHWAARYPLIHKQHQSPGGGFGWPGIFHDMAGGKLGTVTEVEKLPAKNLLFMMEKIEFDREQQESPQ